MAAPSCGAQVQTGGWVKDCKASGIRNSKMSDLWVVATLKNGRRLLRHFLTTSASRTVTKVEHPGPTLDLNLRILRILRLPEYPQNRLQGRTSEP